MIKNNIELVPNKILLFIKNVIIPHKCKNIIDITESIGYKPVSLYTDKDGVEHFDEYSRKGLRCIVDDDNFAKQLEEIIFDYIPKTYNNMKYHSINPRFRYLKYDNCGYFARHSDSPYIVDDKISLITILIYLNCEYTGGYTTFFKDVDDRRGFVLIPETGMICLMDQTIGHKVPPIIKGIKYVVRTELMYISM